ncbi:MAG: homoserine dehydrogenase [Alphaproteobacteria bacterium]|nr:homoserine dehydrogenase [Alphaproteobacteria bacterium]
MSDPLRLGIAGLGTVGVGVVKLLTANSDAITRRCGRPVEITAVSARNREKYRGVDLKPYAWEDDPVALAGRNDVDVVVELVGGSDGPAKALVETALSAGMHVVTANKALLAVHGTALAKTADATGAALAYEAAIAGGIPIVKALREGLAGDRVTHLYGILNGTCNYILSEMRTTGRSFQDILADAQELGYAEADPTFDVEGIDAAHKLALLAALGFGREVNFDAVYTEGISKITPEDLIAAEELGYRIKLLGIACQTDHGIEQRVHPCMVPADSAIAPVEDVVNAVVVEADPLGQTVYEGRGAGEGPTASAVVADICDLARGNRSPVFGVPADALAAADDAPMAKRHGAYYLRLTVRDEAGVMSGVSSAMAEANVSIQSVLQRGRSTSEPVALLITTHETEEAAMMQAVDAIRGLGAVIGEPQVIRIEHF